jgi:hypothetical protein
LDEAISGRIRPSVKQLEIMRLLKKSAKRGSAGDKRWGKALHIR